MAMAMAMAMDTRLPTYLGSRVRIGTQIKVAFRYTYRITSDHLPKEAHL
jgi:hypothetical protein